LEQVLKESSDALEKGAIMKCSLLKTNRLVLREFNELDWQAVHEYASDPQVVRYMPWGPNAKKESQGFIQRVIARQQEKPRRNYEFAVALKTEDRLIGSCGINISNPGDQEGWIGYCFNRHFWGQGYATEATRALLCFVFSQLKLHRIFATCDTKNIASARVLEKIGMQREGHLREYKWVRGRWRDSFLYAVLDRELKIQVGR